MKYADRGLVENGSPNLTLFNHLHWLVFFIFTAMCYIVFPLTKQMKGDFPENTIKGQICMKMEFTLDQTNLRQRIVNLIFPLIMISTNMRFRISLSNFIKGRNLNMRSCAQFGGKNHRNIMTMDETLKYFLQSMALLLLDNGMIIVFQFFSNKIDTKTRFIIHNIIWVFVINFYFSVYVPLKHIIHSQRTLPCLWLGRNFVTSPKFYVRNPEIVPRRDYDPNITTQHRFSYLSTKLRRPSICRKSVMSKRLLTRPRYIMVKEYNPNVHV